MIKEIPMKYVLAVVAAVTAAVCPPTALAANGDYKQSLCFNPDTGSGVGVPPEIRMTQASQPYAPLAASCSGPLTPSKGIWMSTGVAGGGTHTNDFDTGEMTYEAPAGIELKSGSFYRFWLAPSVNPGRQVMTVHGGQSGIYWGTPAAEVADWYHAVFLGEYPWASRGNSSIPLAPENKIDLVVGDAKRWRVTLACDSGPERIGCDVAPGEQSYRIFAGTMNLRDLAGPTVTRVEGKLASSAVLSGNAGLTVAASDSGSGVYRARLVIDGQTVSVAGFDANGGKCVDVNPNNADPYEFGSAVPCMSANEAELSLDSRSVPDGEHDIRVYVEDAGGNTATAISRTVEVRNAIPSPPPVQTAAFSSPVVSPVRNDAPNLGDGTAWRLSFALSKRKLRNGQALKYSGLLSGGDRGRKFVDVQVRRSKKRWQVVCSVLTDSAGRYGCRHRFKRTFRRTRYVFRARVRSQAGVATSTIVTPSRSVVVKP